MAAEAQSRKPDELLEAMADMCRYYGYDGELPEHIAGAMAAPGSTETREQQVALLKKLHIHLMALWAKGKIVGPLTNENLTALAKRAESSAAGLEKMKKVEAAEKQRAKAERYRAMVGSGRTHPGWW